MASSELLVLGFVRNFITAHHGSPSHREIANGTGLTRKRVYELIRALVTDGQLIKVAGARGLSLPDKVSEAVRLLRAAGYTVDADLMTLARDAVGMEAITGIPVLGRVAHVPDPESGDPGEHDNSGVGARAAAR